MPVLLWQPPRPVPGEVALLAADIGQGNAVIVRTLCASAASFVCAIDTQECLLDLLFVGDRPVIFTSGRGLLRT